MDDSPRLSAVVTGASSGVGRLTAIELARSGYDLTLVARDTDRLDETASSALATAPSAAIRTISIDLSELEQVRDLAADLADAPPDVVISNAAMVAPVEARNSQGLPLGLAINHLAPYLLLRSLVEPSGSRPTRFVVVGGLPSALNRTPVDLDDLELRNPGRLGWPPSLRPVIAYGRTKNMNLMFINGMEARLPRTSGVTITGAHPGIMRGTRLDRNDRGAARLFGQLTSGMARDRVEDAAARMVWLASDPALAGRSGLYFVGRDVADTPWHVRDPRRVDELWNKSAELVGLQP